MVIKRAKVICKEEEEKAVIEVLRSGRYVKGPNVENFEKEFAEFCNTKHAIALNSGTSALIGALLAADIKRGDEVITTPFTFMATGNAILIVGAKPVFVDIEPESYCINPEKIREKITKKTKAIIPVHLYGQAADMDPINEIAAEKNLTVIEDAAQAHGATYKGRKTGSLGNLGCFSFYPTKNMTVCGDGGMVTTDDAELAEKICMYRDAGRPSGHIDITKVAGYNFRLSEIHAAVGRIQLKRIVAWDEERRRIASWYNQYLSNIKEVQTPIAKDYAYHIYHLYVIRAKQRDELIKFLEKNGVECGVHYLIPLHLQETFRHLKYKSGDFPEAENACKEIISMPIYPTLTENDIKYIAEQVEKFYA